MVQFGGARLLTSRKFLECADMSALSKAVTRLRQASPRRARHRTPQPAREYPSPQPASPGQALAPLRLQTILLLGFGKRCFRRQGAVKVLHNHVDAASLGLAIRDCKERKFAN